MSKVRNSVMAGGLLAASFVGAGCGTEKSPEVKIQDCTDKINAVENHINREDVFETEVLVPKNASNILISAVYEYSDQRNSFANNPLVIRCAGNKVLYLARTGQKEEPLEVIFSEGAKYTIPGSQEKLVNDPEQIGEFKHVTVRASHYDCTPSETLPNGIQIRSNCAVPGFIDNTDPKHAYGLIN